MNLKNLAMWAVIVFLTIGLYNMFKSPQSSINKKKDTIIFSEFLSEVDNGRVVEVQIQGNNIYGILSNGNKFSTYSPNDPNLIEKLTNKGVSISAAPIDEKMPSLFGVLLSWFPMLLLIAVWIFFMRQMQGGKGGAMGFGRSKAKMINELKGKFLELSYSSKKWAKWISEDHALNKNELGIIAGHYVFPSDEFTDLKTKIQSNLDQDLDKYLIKIIKENILRYLKNFNLLC